MTDDRRLWLKSEMNADGTPKYSRSHINYYPTLQQAVAIVSTYLMAVYCDYTGHRFIANVIMFASVFISSIMILVWKVGTAGHFFAYSISGIGYAGQATNFAWANSVTREDEMLRSVTLFSMNLWSNIWALWYGIAVWPVVQAPKFRNGQIATLVTGAVSVAIAAAIVYCTRRWPPSMPQDNAIEEATEKGYEGGGEVESHVLESEDKVIKG